MAAELLVLTAALVAAPQVMGAHLPVQEPLVRVMAAVLVLEFSRTTAPAAAAVQVVLERLGLTTGQVLPVLVLVPPLLERLFFEAAAAELVATAVAAR